MKSRIHEARVVVRRRADVAKGRYVLYWMQQSVRTNYHHALEYAVEWSKELGQPLLVVFGLMDDYPEANARHYWFLLQGLRDVGANLKERGIKFVCAHGHPAKVAVRYGTQASVLVMDKGYLRHQRQWRQEVVDTVSCPMFEVETDAVVPVEVVSDKREFAARTIRPKIKKLYRDFLQGLGPGEVGKESLGLDVEDGFDLGDPDAVLAELKVDRSVAPVSLFVGGEEEAKRVFRRFRDRSFARYAKNRNQPQTDDVSLMSMYLHFGQVSPVWLLNQLEEHEGDENVESFVEELLIRRELSLNFVYYADAYDRYEGLPEWARKTLGEHERDVRSETFSRQELEEAQTHDDYWNAAMREMRYTGYMHNYMRMYWGKKILEWTDKPATAFARALYLNNRYFLDGRDANSFTGVAWVFGNHDRPWTERKIFGKVRYMAASGLERKCDIRGYVRKVDRLVDQVSQ